MTLPAIAPSHYISTGAHNSIRTLDVGRELDVLDVPRIAAMGSWYIRDLEAEVVAPPYVAAVAKKTQLNPIHASPSPQAKHLRSVCMYRTAQKQKPKGVEPLRQSGNVLMSCSLILID